MYRPEMEMALARFSNEFDDIATAERQPVIDFNAVNPLSDFRERFQNASNTASEHKLSTSADTNDTAFIATRERGQYVSGYEVQLGVGVRIPSTPTGDSEMRWGYYEADDNDDPTDGFYFGVDSTSPFVAHARNGTVTKTRQSDWNNNTADGTDDEQSNPAGVDMDLEDGQIYQIEFSYYGYGPVKYRILADGVEAENTEEATQLVTLHEQRFEGNTSISQTSLPLRQEIVSGGTSNDALDLFVGGRQFSIVGQYSTNNREMSHYLDSLTGIDDTEWYPAISIQIKDGSDIGSIDFSNVISELFNVEYANDNVPKRWQIRRDTTPNNPSWEDPSGVEGDTGETAMKVDTNSTSITEGGNATGFFMDGGTIAAGDNQRRNARQAGATGKITRGDIVSLCFRAQPGEGTGAVNAVTWAWEERW